MLGKLYRFTSGLPATLVGGVFLLLSLIFRNTDLDIFADPAWATVVVSGYPLLYLSVRRIIFNPGISKISSALLITIAMTAAVIIGDIFAAGEVAFIMAIGGILEDMTANRAKKGLKKLVELAPAKGRRVRGETEEIIAAELIQSGDVLRILPGERIPVDGIILSGQTSVDQSVMTGESLPADKAEGDELYCGTLNLFGSVDMRATKVGNDSSLQKLIDIVKKTEENKAPTARIADRCASLLVPAALIIAVIAGIVTRDIVRAVTVLVVFCPCALVLATPTAIMAAIGQATKHGVIIKSGEALEKMGKVDTVAFDKTGTLTQGALEVCDIIPLSGKTDEAELLKNAASAESRSEHPLGKAVAACALAKKIKVPDSEDFVMYSGRGVSATVSGKRILCGNEKFVAEMGTDVGDDALLVLERLKKEGKALVLVVTDRELCGVIALSDRLRDSSVQTVRALSALNVGSVLLTGDNRDSAGYFAAMAGIEDVRAGLLPHEKVSCIDEMQADGRTVCMVGDGVNDAPALKAADVGVAMGGMGSDISIEAADIALMGDDVSMLPYLKRLSNATVRTIKFSISLSMLINIIAVVLSVAGVLNPTTGALVHNAGSCFVVLIAALLYDRKFDRS